MSNSVKNFSAKTLVLALQEMPAKDMDALGKECNLTEGQMELITKATMSSPKKAFEILTPIIASNDKFKETCQLLGMTGKVESIPKAQSISKPAPAVKVTATTPTEKSVIPKNGKAIDPEVAFFQYLQDLVISDLEIGYFSLDDDTPSNKCKYNLIIVHKLTSAGKAAKNYVDVYPIINLSLRPDDFLIEARTGAGKDGLHFKQVVLSYAEPSPNNSLFGKLRSNSKKAGDYCYYAVMPNAAYQA